MFPKFWENKTTEPLIVASWLSLRTKTKTKTKTSKQNNKTKQQRPLSQIHFLM